MQIDVSVLFQWKWQIEENYFEVKGVWLLPVAGVSEEIKVEVRKKTAAPLHSLQTLFSH